MHRKKKLAVYIIIILVTGISLFFLLIHGDRSIEEGAKIYIEAMRERDFKRLHHYHVPSQRRIALVYKTPASKESQQNAIDLIYKDQMASFEQAAPSTNLKHMWSEKFLFIKEMNYTFTSLMMLEDIENPSLPVKKRMIALIEMETEYTSQDTAPDIDGKVKRATYLIRMIHSRNIARTWEEKTQEERWLFDSTSLKDKSITYWQ